MVEVGRPRAGVSYCLSLSFPKQLYLSVRTDFHDNGCCDDGTQGCVAAGRLTVQAVDSDQPGAPPSLSLVSRVPTLTSPLLSLCSACLEGKKK